jgi:type II secretory pathway predicted ATPase ExeA
LKSASKTEIVASALSRPTVAVPDTIASTDMAPILAEIDAEMARSAAAENADAPAPPAAMSADREAKHSAVERTAGADTTQGPDLRASPALSERDAAIRPPASGSSGVGDGQKKRYAEVSRPDATNLALASGAEFRSRLCWFIGVSDARSQDPGSLTYEPYFGLREKPFSLSSDPRFFFSNSSHGAAFDTLAAGIRRREGVLVLTGEVGTGKTTLCRAVLQSLDQKTFAAFVPDPFLSREDLLKTLLVDFGVVSVDEIRSGRLRGASRTDLSYPLYDFLASLQPLKAFAVVMIDEAQNLTAELLEEIRILSDLENGQKLLEVFLVGQPELQSRLATPTMRQLSQRVSIRCELSPLTREDVTPYVSHRLTIAGNDGRVQFTDAAIDLVCAASNGIPRVINLVCDRALLRAARFRKMSVEAEHVVWAVDDLKLPVAETLHVPSLDQARAPLEFFPKEFQEAPAEPEDQPQPPPQDEGSLPAEDQPQPPPQDEGSLSVEDQPQPPPQDEGSLPAGDQRGAPLESFPRESQQASAEREDQPQPPQSEGLLPVSDAVANRPDGLARGMGPSPIDFSSTELGSQADDTRGSGFPKAAAQELAFEEDFAAARQRRRRWLALVGACLAFTTGLVGYWYSMAPVSRQSDVLAQPAQPRLPLQAPPVGAVNLSATPEGRLTGSPNLPPNQTDAKASAPGASSADVVSPAREGKLAGAHDPVPGQTAARFALQMATFQSPARTAQAVQEFRDAGYHAYSVEVSLRDGNRALAVFLGPYTELGSAERDLARARQIPGYGSGVVVQIGPSVLPPKFRP